jgi:hypothetical protein
MQVELQRLFGAAALVNYAKRGIRHKPAHSLSHARAAGAATYHNGGDAEKTGDSLQEYIQLFNVQNTN